MVKQQAMKKTAAKRDVDKSSRGVKTKPAAKRDVAKSVVKTAKDKRTRNKPTAAKRAVATPAAKGMKNKGKRAHPAVVKPRATKAQGAAGKTQMQLVERNDILNESLNESMEQRDDLDEKIKTLMLERDALDEQIKQKTTDFLLGEADKQAFTVVKKGKKENRTGGKARAQVPLATFYPCAACRLLEAMQQCGQRSPCPRFPQRGYRIKPTFNQRPLHPMCKH
jgi:hypothetical protein